MSGVVYLVSVDLFSATHWHAQTPLRCEKQCAPACLANLGQVSDVVTRCTPA